MQKLLAILFLAAVVLSARPVVAVTILTVPVGNPGNAGELSGAGAGGSGPDAIVGSVSYNYRIGKYEVTNAQYAEFLNAKAASDPLGLYNTLMDSSIGGITRNGSSPSFTDATIAGRGDKPVIRVSWYDAIRFANWLHNGQASGDTETGAYTLFGGSPTPSNGLSITRNAGAIWFLASESEWYKAAYYDSTGSSYFDYPTASNTAPIAEAPPGGGNSANYDPAVLDLTNVGAYTASDSPYGTFDQGGNLWEWNEALISGSSRSLRGGSWDSTGNKLLASLRFDLDPSFEFDILGFRVATIPEPSTAVLAIVGMVCLAIAGWRRKR